MKWMQILQTLLFAYCLAWVPMLFIGVTTLPMQIVFGTSIGLSAILTYGNVIYAKFYCKHTDSEEIMMRKCKRCGRVVEE